METDLRTERTNCTTRGKKESTSWKVESVEMWLQGRKELRVLWRGEVLTTERRERKKERKRHKTAHKGIAQEKNFSKTIDWGKERADYHKFLQAAGWKSEVLEVCTITMVEPVEKESRDLGAETCSVIPLGHSGRDGSPSWSAFGRGNTVSQGTKETLRHWAASSLPYLQRCLLRAANLGAGF